MFGRIWVMASGTLPDAPIVGEPAQSVKGLRSGVGDLYCVEAARTAPTHDFEARCGGSPPRR
jgi:hypothetical protein